MNSKGKTLSGLLLFFLLRIYAQNGAEVIRYDVHSKIEDQRLVQETTWVIQVNNRRSDPIADITIPYQKKDKLTILEATVLDKRGMVVRSLDEEDIVTRSSISSFAFYEDDLEKTFHLRWNEYPYTIKYRYRRISDDFIYIAYWYPQQYSNVRVRSASLKVDVPKEYEARLDFPKEIEYEVTPGSEYDSHLWHVEDMEPVTEELHAPPVRELLPSVKVVPLHFTYGVKGSFDSWSSFGNWKNRLNDGLDVLPAVEQEKVNEMIKGMAGLKLKSMPR